jgi:sarcosine oxidase subunit alpha
MQAGVRVKAVVEAAPGIGGYFVHASKIRRLGVPIMTSCTVKRAYGAERLEGVTICSLDEMWNPIPGTETDIETDVLCISVGLSPLADLMWQIGCNMKYIPELGGHVPLRNKDLETSSEGIYVAGDASGIEEASSAMVEGRLAGLCAARSIDYETEEYAVLKSDCIKQLKELRSGPAGEKIRYGLEKVVV